MAFAIDGFCIAHTGPGQRQTMIQETVTRHTTDKENGWLSRERALALALVVASGIAFYLCYRLVLPFLPALAWALALAVIAHPLHVRMKRCVPHVNLAAALSVVVVSIVIVVPVIYVTQNLLREAGNFAATIQEEIDSGRWRRVFNDDPRLQRFLPWIESQLGLKSAEAKEPADSGTTPNPDQAAEQPSEQATMPQSVASVERAAGMLTRGVGSVMSQTVWFVMQLFITLLSLFFFFRDRERALEILRSLLPLSRFEADEVLARVDDTIHATIYGSLVVAAVQGTMGGLMFWWLGLPAPLLWGAIMAALAVVPVLGTFVVWAPTAAYLALRGDWTSALILAAWGGIAIATIDNFLFPFLVGKRMRFHTLLVFFAIVGGLALFGASGVILGPVLLAIADALLEVWRRRTAFGGTIEGGADAC